jgi:hypothetical protein
VITTSTARRACGVSAQSAGPSSVVVIREARATTTVRSRLTQQASAAIVRIALSALALITPAFLMGMTYPLVLRAFSATPDGIRRHSISRYSRPFSDVAQPDRQPHALESRLRTRMREGSEWLP